MKFYTNFYTFFKIYFFNELIGLKTDLKISFVTLKRPMSLISYLFSYFFLFIFYLFCFLLYIFEFRCEVHFHIFHFI